MTKLRVTFDTNTIDKAARPGRFPKDPGHADFAKVNAALAAGKLSGYFSETIISMEGIQNKDRALVFNSTRLRLDSETETVANGATKVEMRHVVEQKRDPLHPEHAARIAAAVDIGMKALKAPRFGALLITDPEGKYFVPETPDQQAQRISKFQQVLHDIESRGAGFTVVKALAQKLAMRDGVHEPWLHSLVRAKDVHEENGVKRAIAEWADADSIAAHVGYGIDLFCTGDAGKSAGGAPSVHDAANRAWLQVAHGVRFVTISELAAMF